MTSRKPGSETDPWGSFEPYAQLIRSLMPRASSVAMFDAHGEMRWTSETTTGPDLANLIEDVLPRARDAARWRRRAALLEGILPCICCWLRNDVGGAHRDRRRRLPPEQHRGRRSARSFSLAHAFLRPALECLRRDLLARAAIDDLNRSVTSLDRDLELLLTDTAGAGTATGSDSADELKDIVQQAMEHLRLRHRPRSSCRTRASC